MNLTDSWQNSLNGEDKSVSRTQPTQDNTNTGEKADSHASSAICTHDSHVWAVEDIRASDHEATLIGKGFVLLVKRYIFLVL
jgi:hypothetical protein